MKKKIFLIIQHIVILPIKFYQYCLAPIIPNCCRFDPSCSEYSKQAIIKFGILRGILLTFKRLIKCHPFGKKGYDPIE